MTEKPRFVRGVFLFCRGDVPGAPKTSGYCAQNGRRQSNFASLSSKFASQKLPLPYEMSSFVTEQTFCFYNFTVCKNQPVGECLGAPESKRISQKKTGDS